jgi:sulfate permease, SulP family
MIDLLSRYVPVLDWGRRYNRVTFGNDLIAAVIVTIMLIPQSLAYSLLAGLPPEAGIYASIAPIILYAIFGTSRALAVGPVAVVSLLTATAVGQIAAQGTVGYITAALTLAFLSGGFLVLLGIFRLGFLANFLSHPVISGFITASGILIAMSQLKYLLGINAGGDTVLEMGHSILAQVDGINWIAIVLGVSATAFLFWVRKGLKPLLSRMKIGPIVSDVITKAGPVVAVFATTSAVWLFELDQRGVAIVGAVPQSLPPLTMPSLDLDLLRQLALPAILISIIGFVESISVAQTLAAKKRQQVSPDQELIGLGAANIAASVTGGFPVTGGFSRSVVNFDAGAETPAAGAYTAIGLAIAALFLTPLVFYLPKATLAATIIVAVLSLVDFSILRKTWTYSKFDFSAVFATIVLTLVMGVEIGVAAGVLISIALHLYKTSRPHVAEVGLVPDTQHFRNLHRHQVHVDPTLVTLRVDESLYFVNSRFLEDLIRARIAKDLAVKNVVLMCSAVNEIDFSALESLEVINQRLKDLNIGLHLSEVKGPVMDRLKASHLLENLNGRVFLSQFEAWKTLTQDNEAGNTSIAHPA